MPGEHGHGCCSCGDDAVQTANQSLLPFILVENVVGFNEQVPGTAAKVFKPFDRRLDETASCRSPDGDSELLIVVPFSTPCKLTSLRIIGGDRGASPKSVKLYANRDDIDFSTVSSTQTTQEFDLAEDFCGMVEYPLKATKFSSITSLGILFPESMGADFIEIFYIDIRGVGSTYKRAAVTTVYEARANLADHPVENQIRPAYGL